MWEDNDICSLLMKRVYDIAASTSKQIKVGRTGNCGAEVSGRMLL